MHHETDFYGKEGAELTPEEEMRLEDAWLTKILAGIEDGKLKILVNRREGQVMVYEAEADDERNEKGEIDPARVILLTDLRNFNEIRNRKIMKGINLEKKDGPNN